MEQVKERIMIIKLSYCEHYVMLQKSSGLGKERDEQ